MVHVSFLQNNIYHILKLERRTTFNLLVLRNPRLLWAEEVVKVCKENGDDDERTSLHFLDQIQAQGNLG